nr:acyltransferase family protein [uncultured Phascolarctobacterium sp.]
MKRDSNIELLRILAILMIIASHFSLHGIFRSTQFQNNLIVADFFNQFIAASLILGDVGVGIFFTITGYFYSCKEKIMLNKKIIAAIISYSVLNVVIIFLFGFNVLPTLSNKELVKYILKMLLMPITSSTWWFASAYIYLIVLISPLVNSRIKNTSKKGYYILVVLMLFLCIYQTY